MFKSYFERFIGFGQRPEDHFHEGRKVRISNYLILIVILQNLYNIFNYSQIYFHPVLLTDAFSSLVFAILAYYLHGIGHRVVVRHLMMAVLLVSLCHICFRYGENAGFQFYLYFFSIIGFFLFDKLYASLTYGLLILASLLVFELHFAKNPIEFDPKLAFTYFPNLFLAVFIFFFVMVHFKSETEAYQKIVEEQNGDLSQLSIKLMSQKDEILITNNKLRLKTSQLEQQAKSIYESLRLASLVQHEALPPEELVFQGIKSGMILYKAKDVVSGDFYWAKNTLEGTLVVVADCIGHGVPGGMMAVLAANLISQIVEEQGLTFPSDILKELDKRLRRRIKQDPGSDLADGMDIAIVLVSAEKVSFSSASRPLVKISQNGEAKVFKGTRFQLATWKTEFSDFETLELDFQKGDRFYLFTDGATDQLSEHSGKRFSTKKLVDELVDLRDLPFSKLKTELEFRLKAWQGNENQTDDMLIIGFEA
jgi:serine phosphatase RsbU (regulator of sigma subunit)